MGEELESSLFDTLLTSDSNGKKEEFSPNNYYRSIKILDDSKEDLKLVNPQKEVHSSTTQEELTSNCLSKLYNYQMNEKKSSKKSNKKESIASISTDDQSNLLYVKKSMKNNLYSLDSEDMNRFDFIGLSDKEPTLNEIQS